MSPQVAESPALTPKAPHGRIDLASKNFEFLRTNWKELAALGAFAEQYAVPDPASCLVKLRSLAEGVTDFIYHRHGLAKPPFWNLNELLNDHVFQQAVPRVVVDKLHALRKSGNAAAHGGRSGRATAVTMLEEGHNLACWLYLAYGEGAREECGTFEAPRSDGEQESEDELKRERKAILQKLAAQEGELQRLLKELETVRSEAHKAEATAEELQEALLASESAANTLSFDEVTTRRRLIDAELTAAGWDVGPGGANTEQVTQEEEVEHQPTESGKGYADYVLWADDGKPLAVVEAKRTAKSPDAGRQQAKCYADGLEEMHGRRPVIFYTNGYETTVWDDAMGEPPRRVFGFHSKDSLEYLHFQRPVAGPAEPGEEPKAAAEDAGRYESKGLPGKLPPGEIEISRDIVDRMYQIEAAKRVIERFSAKHRKALIVQATGTGKTRVAVSLCHALLRARWARRILFLCDRRELRKQARDVFAEFLPGDPHVYVTSQTYKEREHRIYLATYPAMMKVYESFDVGFFDLIIADESHRSIYNRYRDLFLYFDSLQVGLTATPVSYISRNTYRLFGCEDEDPTAHFSYEDAVSHSPPWLSQFKVFTYTTDFLRRGIKYSQMTQQQKEQLEEDEAQPEAIEHEQREVDRAIFNQDTNRHILRNLMDNGFKIRDGSQLGKTIIFSRSHDHAKLLEKLFDEMYPQYGGKFCRVIDTYEPRAEDLIGELKTPDSDLTIAISVDMLDTGIDIPEVVNLVFAKPVYSLVKFWQMFGRGTRLCRNLLGPGQDKTCFYVFDHWGNFEYFDEEFQPAEPSVTKSLVQRLFESRVALAETALAKPDPGSFEIAIELLVRDIRDLPERTIAVQEKWKQVLIVKEKETLQQFEAATQAILTQDLAPLMNERNVRGTVPAHQLDLLVCRMQSELLKGSARLEDLKAELLGEIDQLRMNLSQVKARAEMIRRVRSQEFWEDLTVGSLEQAREELRGVMRYKQEPVIGKAPPKVIDVEEEEDSVQRAEYKPKLEGMALAAYRQRVGAALQELFETNDTLQRIRRGQPVREEDLTALVSLVLTQYPGLDLSDLLDYYPEVAGHLDLAIRSIIGLDAAAVHERFSEFVRKHTKLTSTQIKFLDMLQNHIARNGSIELDRLYEEPFTTFDVNGIDGIFEEDQIDDLLEIISIFSPPGTEEEE